MQLCEKLLLNYPDKLGSKTAPLYKAVIFCITSGMSQVRRACFPILKSMINDDNRGSSLARALFQEFTVFLDSPSTKVSFLYNMCKFYLSYELNLFPFFF